jgi:hypothetical protein
VPFPRLVIIGPGRPETVLEGYGFTAVSPGVYYAVRDLMMCVVVLAELPRTRATLLLRLLSRGRQFLEALADLAALPEDAWEKSVAAPLLIHFQLTTDEQATSAEDEVSAEIQAWFKEYQRQQREETERSFLLRQLRARFGDVPAAAIARIEAARSTDLEEWGVRLLDAKTLDDMFNERSD